MKEAIVKKLIDIVDGSISFEGGKVIVKDAAKLRQHISKLVEVAALGSGAEQGLARYFIRCAAMQVGAYPASINDLYIARGEGKVPFTFTVPAMNLRVLAFDSARAVFRAAKKVNTAAMIFEIARSEMNYTDQRPTEYSASILGAAIAEGYEGPVFIQGDHFQVSAKRYAADAKTEIDALKALIVEAVAAGFYNIDVDTSTLVDLDQKTIDGQQKLNIEVSALLSAFIRSVEPKGVPISIGGEIGEVGGHNSTAEELHSYLDGFKKEFIKVAKSATGLSKISIQTGTSHGGVVLPDGSIAKVEVDFDTMLHLSRLARSKYGLGGAVQHGASTLPEDAFGKFVEAEACEVHLATNFMNMFFDRIPITLREEMYAYLRENNASDRKPDMTDEQFYYKTRKSVIGPFKKQSWGLPSAVRDDIGHAWEEQFLKLFRLLGLKDTRQYVDKYVQRVDICPDIKDYLGEEAASEDVSDLAD
jgi:fructose/tagatose bisphosphate aldolase